MLPLHETGMASGLLCGVLFGYVLENAGFGSPLKLSSQFRLTDWSVFKVMFTAIVVAAFGFWGMRAVGLMAPDTLAVPPALLMAAAVGGALVGAGFAVGGYCPGTSLVAMSSGRLDAIVFFVGLFGGTYGFAAVFGPAMRSMMAMGTIAEGDNFTDAYGVSEVTMLAILAAALVAIYYLGGWFERRGSGPVNAEQALAGAE
jgi:hypothetical protein